MKLFDDIVRTTTKKNSFSGHDYSYLNESARLQQKRIRTLLEQWFADFARMSQTDPLTKYQDKLRNICAEFRSENTRKHWAAFFEIYCHELLSTQRYIVEVEPTRGMTKGRSIDFLAYREEIPLFYLEAAISIGDKAKDKSLVWLDNLCDSLDKLDSSNFRLELVAINIPLKSSKTPSTKTLLEYVEKQLAERDPDEVFSQMNEQGLPSLLLSDFDEDEFKIEIYLRPVSPERRQTTTEGILSPIAYPAEWSYDSELKPLLTTLEDKRPSKYGELDLPYIIAVNAVYTMSPRNVSNTLINQRYFEKHQKVSAILMANELIPRAIPRNTPVLWHNPFATYPLDRNA
ncbi:MAG TPA: hypothetical protein VEP90_14180, partial [Methylomirabilota bacterium]|nr:hypothetical protein [Methylomirabilota bacterium]